LFKLKLSDPARARGLRRGGEFRTSEGERMPKFWMITNRKAQKDGFSRLKGELSYWTSDATSIKELRKKDSWAQMKGPAFKKALAEAAAAFPALEDPELQYKQKHVSLFVHGYNNSWIDAINRYHSIQTDIMDPAELGICVLFTWPSDGMKMGYVPDRIDARRTADDLSFVFSELYKHMQGMQQLAMDDPAKECRAKVSVLAHSMGAFVAQKALAHAWTNQNQPLTAALVNQMLLISADVDSDLFSSGENVDGSDGDAMANLCYRIACRYTGRDPILGVSAGLKHFGSRRLGRSGLRKNCATPPCYPDNVWDYDVSKLIPPGEKNIHSASFEAPLTIRLIQLIMQGFDRQVIIEEIERLAVTTG
jgi:hypothetical protein